MKKNKLTALFILSTALLVGCQGNNNSSNTDSSSYYESTSTSETITLGFSSCVVSATENEGELNIKATNKFDVGTIHYILLDSEQELNAGEIINHTVNALKYGSSTEKNLTDLVSGLEAGKEYFGYFVIEHNGNSSSIVTRSATTYKNSVDMGDGTETNPFKIYTLEDLEAIGTSHPTYNLDFATDAHYILMDDIDLSTKYGASTLNWKPIQLDGYFDGNNHTISNLYIKDENPKTNLGLFAQVNTKANLKNLTLSGVTIEAKGYIDTPRTVDESGQPTTKDVGDDYSHPNLPPKENRGVYIGALAGDVKGVVENCHVKNASLDIDGGRVGGLTGRLYSDTGTSARISSCSVEATIKGYGRLGGIVGLVDNKSSVEFTQAVIEDVTFKGTIEGSNYTVEEGVAVVASEYIGGIAGYFRSADLKNAVVSEANISGYRHVGGIVGFQQKNKNASQSHYAVIKGALFSGETHVQTGSNAGPIVGNRSTSNVVTDTKEEVEISSAFYIDSSKFYVGDKELAFEDLKESARFGVSVSLIELSSTWYSENLSTFDFENKYELNAQNIPVLK